MCLKGENVVVSANNILNNRRSNNFLHHVSHHQYSTHNYEAPCYYTKTQQHVADCKSTSSYVRRRTFSQFENIYEVRRLQNQLKVLLINQF